MRKANTFFLIGLILLIAGGAALVYGIITFNTESGSISGFFGKIFNTYTEKQNQALLELIIGGAAAIVGLVLLVVRRR
jgi:hypothetical protein